MGIEEGETGTLIQIFENYYGEWCRVQLSNDRTSDVSASGLDVIIPKG